MIEELERLTREYFDEDTTSTHLDYAIAQIESGIPIAGIARTIGSGINQEIQRQVLSRYLHDLSPDAALRISEARPIMAHAMAEDALGIADEEVNDKLDVARNALRARTREGLAKMFNPEFQQAKQQGVTLNIGTLHLSALRSPNAPLVHARSIEPTVALVASATVAINASDNREHTA